MMLIEIKFWITLDDALEVFRKITELPNPSGPFPMHSLDLSKHLGPPQSLHFGSNGISS